MFRILILLLLCTSTGCIEDHTSADLEAAKISEFETYKKVHARQTLCTERPLHTFSLDIFSALQATTGAFREKFQQESACILAAEDCKAVYECTKGPRGMPCEQTCQEENCFTKRCEGNRLITCSAEPYQTPRTLYEFTTNCADRLDGKTLCTDLPVSHCGSPETCETSHCEGDVSVFCHEGQPTRRDCSQRGRSCFGEGRCLISETGCSPCFGDMAQECDGTAIKNRTDCKVAGLVCQDFSSERNTYGLCAPPSGSQCTPDDEDDSCAGTVANVCISRGRQLFDCAEVGATCEVRGGHAYCIQ